MPKLTEVFLVESSFKRREGLDPEMIIGAVLWVHDLQERIRASRDLVDRAYTENHVNKGRFVRDAKERIDFYLRDPEAIEGWNSITDLQPGRSKELRGKLKELKTMFAGLDGSDLAACADAKFAFDLLFTSIAVATAKVIELYRPEIEADGAKLEPYEKKAADTMAWLHRTGQEEPGETSQYVPGTDPDLDELMRKFERVKALVNSKKDFKN